jgi:hypothetical protein
LNTISIKDDVFDPQPHQLHRPTASPLFALLLDWLVIGMRGS